MNQTSQQEQQELNARYVYCIGLFNGRQISCKGIEGNPVKMLRVEELCALVHECKPEPYATEDSEKAKEWIIQHNNVVDKAMQSLGAIIPFAFDTIFKEEQQLIEFLNLNREKIKEKLKWLEGKKEFGIKIFYDESLKKQAEEEKKEKLKQVEEVEKESKGKAYFLRKKIEREISDELQSKLKKQFEEFYKKISALGEIVVEETKEKNMLANFSCLVSEERIEELNKILDEINKQPFSIRFTGPWPPYLFVRKIFEEKNDS